jgi:integrase
MPIKKNAYLSKHLKGNYVFQIHVPFYMEHLFNSKVYRVTTNTKDLEEARRFRDHMLLEWNELKRKHNPASNADQNIANAIASLHQCHSKPRSAPSIAYATSPTLKAVCDEYVKRYDGKKAFSTLSKAQRAVTVFLQTLGRKDIKLQDVKRSIVSGFLQKQEKKYAPQTLQNWLTSLGSLYKYARRVHDDLPSDNPFYEMDLCARSSIESYQPFTMRQLSKLIDSAEGELKDVILIGLYTGMRLDEICSMTKSNVQDIEGIKCFYIDKSKTKAGIRHVPIHSILLPIVENYLPHNKGEYLFPYANKIKRADGKKGPNYSQAFTRLRNKVIPGATDRQCFHSLRGHFITQLDREGVEETRIGTITGQIEKKAKTEAFKTYSAGPLMRELQQIVELVKYEGL